MHVMFVQVEEEEEECFGLAVSLRRITAFYK